MGSSFPTRSALPSSCDAARTEFYIKAGLVLLGAEVLLPRLLELGVPGGFGSLGGDSDRLDGHLHLWATRFED
ncbi:MAG: hypothetical protein R3B96_08545 [Pirellulaceae bacterium]